MNVNQSCQRQTVSLSRNTREKYTSSLCIFPRNNSFSKYSAIENNQNRQMKKSCSLDNPVKEQNTDQKEFSKLRSNELPRTAAEVSSSRYKIYVSSVKPSLSNSSKVEEAETQSFGKASNESNRSETYLKTQKEQGDFFIDHFQETVETNDKPSTDMFGNDFITKYELRTTQKDNGNKTDKEDLVEDFKTESREADSKKGQNVTSNTISVIEEEPNKHLVRHERGKSLIQCSHCGSIVSQTTSEQNYSQNEKAEDEVNKNINIHEIPTSKCSFKKTREEKVKIQKLSLMRSLTFSTPGKSANLGTFAKKKPPSLASISIQKRKLWKSMSISSTVPIIVVSSVDE